MHVVLAAADGAPSTQLASDWTRAAEHCVVRTVTLPAVAPEHGDGQDLVAPGAVFVPTEALGLTRTAPTPRPEEERLRAAVAESDLVVVHVPVLDGGGLHIGPVARAARAAAPEAIAVVVLAGRSEVTRRELASAGIAGVHEVGEPYDARAVARAARTWAPPWQRHVSGT